MTLVAFVAVTVSVDEPPAVMEAGLAVMVTVGAGPETTVTVTLAVWLPPAPVAVTVYVVVAAGLTDSVPPDAAIVKLLPSDPAIVTLDALEAVMVRVDALPGAIEAGEAPIVTDGAVGGVELDPLPPQLVTRSEAVRTKANNEKLQKRKRYDRAVFTTFPFLAWALPIGLIKRV